MIADGNSVSEQFWEALAPDEHFVQFYEDDETLRRTLESFVGEGLQGGEAVIVMATSRHLNELEQRLYDRGLNLNLAIAQDQYLPLNAEETLSRFVVDGWPDETQFEQVITRTLARARHGGRRVRAFGELVALMWERGEYSGTVRLEHLWNQSREMDPFALFCAYPASALTVESRDSVQCICDTHTRVISGRRTHSLQFART